MVKQYKVVMIILFAALFCPRISLADAQSLRLNSVERSWYPFLYEENDQIRGLFYDIVSKALESLSIRATVRPVPFRRAVYNARKGSTDGIIGVGFQPDLFNVLDYPPGAEKEAEFPWRIMQVDHVVVTFVENNYKFEGDLKTLPAPVRILTGSPVIGDLRKAEMITEEVKNDFQNFGKLLRDKNGVLITTTVVAEMMNRTPRFKGKIKIHATPVASHSYYLVFSKKSVLSPEARERLWKEIIRWRDDYIFMLQVFSQY